MAGMRRHLSNDRGYSLVELAITVAIIGLTATIAYPSFRSLIPRYKYQNDSNFLASQLTLVRMQAISRNRDYAVSFNTAADRFSVYEGDAAGNFTFKEGRTLANADIYQVDNIENPPAGTSGLPSAPALIYASNGTVSNLDESPPGPSGQIFTRAPDGSLSRRIVVAPVTGKLTVERYVLGTWKDERYLKE